MADAKVNQKLSQWVQRHGAGETLFSEDDIDRRVYVLIDGRVQILKGERQVAEIDVAESFIGEVAALTGRPRSATVKTVTPCTLLVVDDIEDFFRVDPSWGRKLAQVLATRLDRMTDRFDRLHELLQETRQRLGSTESDGGVTQEIVDFREPRI